MDLQLVIDEIAAIMYICSYMTKGEKAMGETLKRVAKECKHDDIRTQMNKIKKEFLGKRVFGSPESAMRILSMWLIKKSRKVTPVNTNMQADRVSLPKSHEQLTQLHDDDEDVFATSLIDRYTARPQSLHNMCLAMFAVNYEVSYSENIADTEHSDNELQLEAEESHEEDHNNLQKIKLHNGLGWMRKRKQEAVM